ncbi:uncharacterized protein FTOL_05313 [Fusarium torulosum]|uniref:Uncharacterized protein n=1 Tax=Fusarium torulosum TaxID=33205 RepID=A0AAE8M7N5_9HYPO|nr:uncharacterized protein FTOL_05313 [Fusarium torulosum]
MKQAYNEDGLTILDNATKPRQRGNSASQGDEDFIDELLDDAFGFGDFNQTTLSTSARKFVTLSNRLQTGAHSNSAHGPSSSPVPASTSTAFAPINLKGNDPTTPSRFQKKSRPDQSMINSFDSSQSLANQQNDTRANDPTFLNTYGSGSRISKQSNRSGSWEFNNTRNTLVDSKPNMLSNTGINNSFTTKPNPFTRAGVNKSFTPRLNVFSAAKVSKHVTFALPPHRTSPAANSGENNIQIDQLAKLPENDALSPATDARPTTTSNFKETQSLREIQESFKRKIGSISTNVAESASSPATTMDWSSVYTRVKTSPNPLNPR